jgi:hypothetical protein
MLQMGKIIKDVFTEHFPEVCKPCLQVVQFVSLGPEQVRHELWH